MLLLTNGTIATMDPARPMAEAAAVDELMKEIDAL